MPRKTTSGSSRSAADDTAPGGGSVATADAGLGASQSDYAQFIWQKLDAIDGHLKDLSEKYGRLDEKMNGVPTSLDGKVEPIKTSLQKVEGKVGELEKSIRWATALIVAGGFIIGLLFAIYKAFESHITFH